MVMMGGKLGTGADLFGGPFGGLIWDQYLIQSPQADGLHQHIPDWVVPPRDSPALAQRHDNLRVHLCALKDAEPQEGEGGEQ